MNCDSHHCQLLNRCVIVGGNEVRSTITKSRLVLPDHLHHQSPLVGEERAPGHPSLPLRTAGGSVIVSYVNRLDGGQAPQAPPSFLLSLHFV